VKRKSGSSSPPRLLGVEAQVAALVASLERRAVEAEQFNATAPVGAVLRSVIAELAAVDGCAVAREPGPGRPDEVPRLLTLADAAAQLGTSVKWLHRHRELPFLRRLSPRVVRVDAASLARWVARRA
jgi:hypothetical protein